MYTCWISPMWSLTLMPSMRKPRVAVELSVSLTACIEVWEPPAGLFPRTRRSWVHSHHFLIHIPPKTRTLTGLYQLFFQVCPVVKNILTQLIKPQPSHISLWRYLHFFSLLYIYSVWLGRFWGLKNKSEHIHLLTCFPSCNPWLKGSRSRSADHPLGCNPGRSAAQYHSNQEQTAGGCHSSASRDTAAHIHNTSSIVSHTRLPGNYLHTERHKQCSFHQSKMMGSIGSETSFFINTGVKREFVFTCMACELNPRISFLKWNHKWRVVHHSL